MPIFINNWGRPVVAETPEEIQAAIDAKFTLESPEQTERRRLDAKYGGLGQQGITFAESVGSGATLGLSDVALTGLLGEEYRTDRRLREEVNPYVAGAGEITGAVAPLFLTGGASAGASGARTAGTLARIASAPTRFAARAGLAGERAGGALAGALRLGESGSVIGRGLNTATRLGVGGAIEGSLYGAGEALSEAALAPGGNYDRLGERLLAGAATGAKLGAVSGGALGFLGGSGAAVAKKGADRLFGAKGLKSMLDDFSESAVVRSMDIKVGDARNLGEDKWRRMARNVRDYTFDDGSKLYRAGAAPDEIAEAVVRAHKETGGALGSLRKQADELIESTGRRDLGPDMGGFFRRADEVVAAAQGGTKSMAKRAKKAAGELENLRTKFEAGEAVSIADAVKFRRELDDIIYTKAGPGGGITVAKRNTEQLTALREELEKTIEDSVERVGKATGTDLGTLYKGKKELFGSLSDANGILKRQKGHEIGRNRFSPFETISGIGGALGAVASGSVLPIAAGAVLGAGRKLFRERGESALAVIANAASKSDEKIAKSVKRFLDDTGSARRGLLGEMSGDAVEDARGRPEKVLKPKKNETTIQAYQRKVRDLNDFAKAPQETLERTMGTLLHEAPMTGAAVASTVARANQFLLDKVPAGLYDEDSIVPHLERPEPDPVELERFARYVEIVDDPLAALDLLEKGNLTRQHVEALSTVYPSVYADIQKEAWTQLSDAKAPPTFYQRMQLGTLLQLPAHKSLDPVSVAASQFAYQQPVDMPAPPPTGAAPDLAQHFDTEMQALEGMQAEI